MMKRFVLDPEKEYSEGKRDGPRNDAVQSRHIVWKGLENLLSRRQVRREDEWWEKGAEGVRLNDGFWLHSLEQTSTKID